MFDYDIPVKRVSAFEAEIITLDLQNASMLTQNFTISRKGIKLDQRYAEKGALKVQRKHGDINKK